MSASLRLRPRAAFAAPRRLVPHYVAVVRLITQPLEHARGSRVANTSSNHAAAQNGLSRRKPNLNRCGPYRLRSAMVDDALTCSSLLASQDVVEIERSAGYAERLITRSIDRAGRE